MSIVNIYNRRKAQKRPKQIKFLSSQDFEIPPGYKSCDIFCVGGGGAGSLESINNINDSRGISYGFAGKSGGPGGYCRTVKNISINPKDILKINVGNGAKPILGYAPTIKKSASDDEKNKYIGCHIFNIQKQGKKYYFCVQTITSWKDNPKYNYIEYETSKEYLDPLLDSLYYTVPNYGSGENSYVLYNDKKIAEAPGARTYRSDLIFGKYGYESSNVSYGGQRNFLYRVNVLEISQGYAMSPLQLKNFYSFGGNLGGSNGEERIAFSDNNYNYRPFVNKCHVGESDGGTYYYNAGYYNNFGSKTQHSNSDYPHLSWGQIFVRSNYVNYAHGGRNHGYLYNVFPRYSVQDEIIPKIKDKYPTYESMFSKNTSFSFSISQQGTYSGTFESIAGMVIGNQKTLSYWLGQENTRAFGESDGEIFAGGGGGDCNEYHNDNLNVHISLNDNDGGLGGGGNGQKSDGTPAQDGTPNTGGGGGYDSNKPGFGGSGIVIIRLYANENRNTTVNWNENTEIRP